MHTQITCGTCRQQMRLPLSYVGKKIQCPACSVRFTAQVEAEPVDVELIEQAEPIPLPVEKRSADSEPLWVQPAGEEERRAGPLRLRKPSPKKAAPKPGRWPAYLFVLAALPLGLPLLAAFASRNRGGDPTATLLMWCGAAVVLTGLCLLLALPGRASVGLRLTGSLMLSGLAYVVALVLFGLNTNEVAAHEWRSVVSPEGEFSASLPGFAVPRLHTGPVLGAVPAQGLRHQVRATRINAVFSIDSFETPANFRPDQFLLSCHNDVNRELPGAQIVRDRRVRAAVAERREFTLRLPNLQAEVRYLATARRVYVLSITTTPGPIGPASRARFFDTFSILPPMLEGLPNPDVVNPPRPKPPAPPPMPLSTIEADGEVRALAFTPDGRSLAIAAEGHGVSVWELPGLRIRMRAALPVNVQTSAVFTPDGKRLAVGGGEGPVTLLDTVTGAKVRTFEPWAGRPVAGFAVSPDGKRLAAATGSSDNPLVRVWDLATGEGRDVMQYRNAGLEQMRLLGVAFTSDSQHVFVSAYRTGPGVRPERMDRVYGVRAGQEPRVISAYRTAYRDKARLSPDGRRLAYFTRDGSVRLWDVEKDSEAAVLGGHAGTVSEVAFAPDGATLASVSTDGMVKLWDATTGQARAEFSIRVGGTATLGKLAFSPDGRTLATALGRKVTLRDVARQSGRN